MISRCNFIPDAVMIRDISESGIRRVTLRRNFTEEMQNMEDINEVHYTYEEVDVLIPERDNMMDFINANFGNLFELGLVQTEEIKAREQNKSSTNKLIKDGSLTTELQLLGQQITTVMLEVI